MFLRQKFIRYLKMNPHYKKIINQSINIQTRIKIKIQKKFTSKEPRNMNQLKKK